MLNKQHQFKQLIQQISLPIHCPSLLLLQILEFGVLSFKSRVPQLTFILSFKIQVLFIFSFFLFLIFSLFPMNIFSFNERKKDLEFYILVLHLQLVITDLQKIIHKVHFNFSQVISKMNLILVPFFFLSLFFISFFLTSLPSRILFWNTRPKCIFKNISISGNKREKWGCYVCLWSTSECWPFILKF